jgi:hypothetical protein
MVNLLPKTIIASLTALWANFLKGVPMNYLQNPDTNFFGDLTILTNHFKQPKLV